MGRTLPLLLVLSLLAAAGCSFKMPKLGFPRVHKITVQQGNVITQEMIDQLKPGMTRSQVAFVMGEPIFRNSFDDDRWDYIYTVEVPGRYHDDRRVSLYFDNDLLAYFTGDYVPTAAKGETAQDAGADAGASASDAG
ncbi:MAG: outer membrane protein assembly factor BamE [Gammaproteobacteria bacterium]|nr:outer membrane protein assembly factor BamE [Gammaproteobacteria bacterium]